MFEGAYLKVERANRHINELIRRTNPLDPALFEFGLFRGDILTGNDDPSIAQLAYKPIKPVSKSLALIIGDVIHNLRASLDHAASEIVGSGRVHFPFSKERKDLVSGRNAKDIALIQKALPNADVASFFLTEIDSCLDGNAALWRVSRADNNDKHNFILPAVTVTDFYASSFIPELRAVMEGCRFYNDADSPFVLQSISNAPDQFVHQYDCIATVDVRFSQVSTFGDEPVIPTLLNSSKVVTETLDAFRRFVSDHLVA